MAETDTQLKEQERTNKYFTNFLYKASLALIFLVIIPLFPSYAPEFINQTVPSRSWELLHLLFVGIAVSYGLFSSRNPEGSEKEPHSSRFDSTQSYVSRLLQTSSVFDDEPDKHSDSADESSKFETWSSQYVRNEPVVLLAEEHKPSVVEQQRVNSVDRRSGFGEKPPLLPVRSLKSRVLENGKEPDDETSGVSSSHSLKRFVVPQRPGQSKEKVEEKEDVVLPSPVPWRSRSGRMVAEDFPDHLSPFSSTMDSDHFQANLDASKPQTVAPSLPNSGSKGYPSQKKLSLSSKELQTKNAEYFMRSKSFLKYPPPPPPPPPILRSSSMRARPSSGFHRDGVSSFKDLRRSYSGEQEDASRARSRKSVSTFQSQKDGALGENGTEGAGKTRLAEKALERAKKPFSSKHPEGFVESVLSESDEESPQREDDTGGTSKDEEIGHGGIVGDGGRDVDKKADEFIAKFREEIRLQRIHSIKRSTAENRLAGAFQG
ncbi:hypothetical protein SAY86_021677 [Trapa natans]|uniref:Hydroxyproline-rich glycoprotein family protein n=1 Tax=Trapa natans TaxID=22666 RepID=A0AAN7MSV5_TRANT|nr:hypothetical protein SAY86_021677 [Trapa natans]